MKQVRAILAKYNDKEYDVILLKEDNEDSRFLRYVMSGSVEVDDNIEPGVLKKLIQIGLTEVY